MPKSLALPRLTAVSLTLLVAAGACRAPFESDNGAGTPPPAGGGPTLPMSVGSSGADFARAVVTDATGNAWVTSYFTGSVDFDGGSDATVRIATGSYDAALAKYGPDGSLQWVTALGGTGADVPYRMVLASDGAVYVTGYLTAGALCSGGQVPNSGGRDIFVMRVSSAGTCDWVIDIGGTGDDEGHDLTLAANGDLLVAGSFSGSVDFDPDSGATVLVSRGGTDAFVARYSAAGEFRTAVQFGGLDDDAANAITTRPDGDPLVAGTFAGEATFGSALAPQRLQSAGELDYFVARITSNTLGLQWAIRGGGPGNDVIPSGGIKSDAMGYAWVAGSFTGTANVGPGLGAHLLISHGDADAFVANYDGSGGWAGVALGFGGPGADGVSVLQRDATGNLYLGGSFQQTVDFDPGSGAHVVVGLGSSGASDAFVLSLTATGGFRWVDPLGAAISGEANYSIVNGLAATTDGSLWAVGRYFGRVDFDPGPDAVVRVSLGDADQFVARYLQATGALDAR